MKSTTQIASGTNGGPAIRDSSEFGSSVTAIGDINGDGIVDLAVGAPRESVGRFTRGQEVGAVYVLLLNRDGTVKSSTRISGTNGGPQLPSFGEFGFSVANVGDLNGDGIDEVAVGSARGKNLKAARGQVSILFLNSDGTVKSSTKIASKVGGGPKLADNDNFGTSVSGVGDLNGDGIKDLVVGAAGDDTNGSNRGAVYTLFLNEKGNVKSFTKIASDTNGGPTILNNERFGESVAAIGDVNGDGITDLAVGNGSVSPLFDSGHNPGGGTINILFMNSDGTVKSSTPISDRVNGGPTIIDTHNFGISVTPVGDLNGDGISELAVGDNDESGTGTVYILFLRSTAQPTS